MPQCGTIIRQKSPVRRGRGRAAPLLVRAERGRPIYMYFIVYFTLLLEIMLPKLVGLLPLGFKYL